MDIMNTKLLEQLLEFTKKYESKITNLNVKNPDEQINESDQKFTNKFALFLARLASNCAE